MNKISSITSFAVAIAFAAGLAFAQDGKVSEEVIVQDTEAAVDPDSITRSEGGPILSGRTMDEKERIGEMSKECRDLLRAIGVYNNYLSDASNFDTKGTVRNPGDSDYKFLSELSRGGSSKLDKEELMDRNFILAERLAALASLKPAGCLTADLDMGGSLNAEQVDSAGR